MVKIPGKVPSLTGITRANREGRFSQSHYYWWYRFLQKNVGYRVFCEAKRKRRKTGDDQYAKLYSDFGDVHEENFERWWNQRGEALFALPPSTAEVMRIPRNEMNLPHLFQYPLLVVAFDCTRGEDAIRKSFSDYMHQHLDKHVGRPPKHRLSVDADYSMTGTPQVGRLSDMYQVLESVERRDLHGLELAFADIGVALNFKVRSSAYGEKQLTQADRRRQMSQKVGKLYAEALRAVEATGKGHFPSVPESNPHYESTHRTAWETDRDRALQQLEGGVRPAR